MLDQRSVTWRHAGDARLLPFLGKPFLLQAAHPTIGAGVADHSVFKEDPFGRFQQSYGLVLKTLYAADGERIGAQVRAAHKSIKGVRPDGERYTAYEPEAAFWVLATGFEGIVTTLRWLGRPMSRPDERRAYDEIREVGRRFWLRDRDMPDALEDFWEWYGWMLDERIENNRTVQDVLETTRRPAPPKRWPALLWPLPRMAAGRLAWLPTVGLLGAELRDRFEVSWSRRDTLELELIRQAYRPLELIPASWWYLPPAREAFGRAKAETTPPPRSRREERAAA